eukprot:TRINITY_DN10702_c0_g1_i6.p3 TRINITY_DN10702_c0_g1~~TRINITY_DN10702_c0_g1_i6.p3  ORF type:complete len:131 (+),score=6.91 TRINITY_DN10702_c0_g1_i6:326-718(+)
MRRLPSALHPQPFLCLAFPAGLQVLQHSAPFMLAAPFTFQAALPCASGCQHRNGWAHKAPHPSDDSASSARHHRQGFQESTTPAPGTRTSTVSSNFLSAAFPAASRVLQYFTRSARTAPSRAFQGHSLMR